MIPYQDLVVALAAWRERQGLPAGAADYLGTPQAAAYDFAAPLTEMVGDSQIVEVGDEMLEGDAPAEDMGLGDYEASEGEDFQDFAGEDGFGDLAGDDDAMDAIDNLAADGGESGDTADYATASPEEIAAAQTVDGEAAVGTPPDMGDELPVSTFGESEETSLDYDVGALGADDQTHDQPALDMPDEVSDDDSLEDAFAVLTDESVDEEPAAEGDPAHDDETADFTRQE